jgi:hypothetical protein
MVVDGGRASAYPHLHKRLSGIAAEGGSLDLYVLTHIDADHIEGALSYLKAAQRPIEPKDVWYNGYRQMRSGAIRSMRQGDDYSVLLNALGWPHNRHFQGGVAAIETAPDELDVAGLRITMLSPDAAHLEALGKRWDKWRREQEANKGADAGQGMRRSRNKERREIPDPLVLENLIADSETDPELPNGTSIAFIAEWHGVRVLFGGDAHPDLLTSSIEPLSQAEGGRFRVDLLKASHHGSGKNTSRQLIEKLDCRRIAISTNGNIHGHPDPEAIARFIHFGPEGHKELYFNYETERTLPWGAATVEQKYGYKAHYPNDTAGVMEIDLLSCADG